MCGRYGFVSKNDKQTHERFFVEPSGQLNFTANYNVAPSQKMPIVVRNSPNHFEVMEWGYVPEWMKKKGMNKAIINARDDKLTSFSYKKAFQFQRCIVPATHFYEWKATSEGKIPYLIKVRSMEMFGFAGMWFEDGGAKKFVIITTSPNELMLSIHNRMPVILSGEEEDEWLNPDNTESEQLLSMINPYDSDDMEAYPISRAVNSPFNNSSEVITPQS